MRGHRFGSPHVIRSTLTAFRRVDEPDVTLTDYLLAVETAFFAKAVVRRPTRRPVLRRWLGAFFGAASVASLAGGTVHGFFGDEDSLGHRIVWPASMLAIGTGAFALAAVGAELGCDRAVARRVTAAAAVAAVGYAAVVLFVSHDFRVAVVAYLPAASFLLVVLVRRFVRQREREELFGVAAIVLAFVAAGVQQGTGALHPRYADHNALYHLIQGVSFACFYRFACRLLDRAPAVATP